MQNIKKILIIRLGAIGDIVHSSELFRSIKRVIPQVEIHYVTTAAPSMMIKNDPDIKKVWVIKNKSYKYIWEMSKELKKENFDICFNLQPSIRTKVFGFLSGAKKQILYKKTFKLHAVENFWQTGKKVFKDVDLKDEIKIYLSDPALQKAKEFVDENKLSVALNMGTSMTRQGRRWPNEYWRQLALSLIEKYNCEILLTGSKEDAELAKELEDIDGTKMLCGKLNIEESAALMKQCDLVISGDTGPLHIATAVETYAIGLYGAAPISRTGPYGPKAYAVNSNMDCVPCNRRKCIYLEKGHIYTPCMVDIKPEHILNVIEKDIFVNC